MSEPPLRPKFRLTVAQAAMGRADIARVRGAPDDPGLAVTATIAIQAVWSLVNQPEIARRGLDKD